MKATIGKMTLEVIETSLGNQHLLKTLVYIPELNEYFTKEWTMIATTDNSISLYMEALTLVSKSLEVIVEDILKYTKYAKQGE